MNSLKSLFLYCLLVGLVGCASHSSKKDEISIPATASDAQTDKILHAVSQQKRFKYMGSDISIVSTLRLPEVESPGEADKTKGDSELVATSEANVANGHLCIDSHVHLPQGANVPANRWSASVIVDGVDVETTGQIYSSTGVERLPGQVQGNAFITICTKKKFLMVLDVVFSLLNSSKEKITQFQWHSPWPK